MRKTLTFLLISVLPVMTLAQAPDSLWSRTFGGSSADYCYSVQQTTDGGYILGGYTWSCGAGSADFCLVKTDASGTEDWSRTFGGSSGDYCYSTQQTADGGYILGGYTWSYGAGGYDFCLVKTDAMGTEEWRRTFGGSADDRCWSVRQTTDGGYILGGHTRSYGAGSEDFWLVKTDAVGTEEWSHTFGGSSDDRCRVVRPTTDGGYVLGGWTSSYGAGGYDFWLVKTDAVGTEEWSHTFGGSSDDRCWQVQQSADGGYILGGWTSSYGAGGYDFWLVKTDAGGTEEWNRTFGGSDDDCCVSVQQTTDGGYILGGYTWFFGAGNYDFWLVRTDGNGREKWSRTFGGSNDDRCWQVQQTADGGYIAGGWTSSYGAGGYDFWLVKTGPEYPNVGYVSSISQGPPNRGYRLHHVSGALSRLVFTNFCEGTFGSVAGAAAAAGWTATDYADSIVFTSDSWLASGTIDTFYLSHPSCNDVITWTAGDSSGTIEEPLPVELTTFEAVAGDERVTLRWQTATEQDNDHFVLYKRRAGRESFQMLARVSGHGTTTEPHDYDYVDRWVQNGLTYEYRISDVDIAGHETLYGAIVSATPERDVLPLEFALHPNWPNPFNPTTAIRYDVKEACVVSLKVFDLLGSEVATLVHGAVPAGSHTLTWDASALPSGVYLCRMEAEGFAQVRKLLLVK